ncbi:hypothetical protein EV356DRAFT_497995 [Viridothelium virens]|uniref:Rhodopsin domain-containing protein n=1 Tax=Viridothelium virens TaxID=1048519 RepID=A0A6A6HEZ8_VIRVR|nr:hypothetical protein EV356DRAFT_497995 [Viridothelium virens]
MILRSKVIWSLNVLCSLGPGFVRTSVILFYQRIFIETPFLMVSWTIFALNATWTLGFFLSNLLSCVPISGNWAVGLPPSSCVDFLMLFKSMVVSSVILDGVVLMLPWYPLWKLNMPTMRKVVVSGILLLGGLAVLFSIFRAVAMFDALVPNPDTTWTRAPAFYWATLETGMGTISACLPTLRPLMSKPGPESMVRSLHRKLRRTLSRTKLSQDSNSMEHFPRESGESGEKSFRTMEAQGPLVYDGPRSTAYDRATRIEAGQNEDLPTSSEAIVVKSTFQSY